MPKISAYDQTITPLDGAVGIIANPGVKNFKVATDFVSAWIGISDTWTYASAITITVPSGATSLYQKGDKIRLKQGGNYKYFVISTVADTLLTFYSSSDYSVANAAITDIYFSRKENPFGWPDWFNNPTVTMNVSYFDDGAGGQPTQVSCRWSIHAKKCIVVARFTGVKATTDANLFVFADTSIPLINRSITSGRWFSGTCTWGSAYALGEILHFTDNNYYGGFPNNIPDGTTINDASFLLNYEI